MRYVPYGQINSSPNIIVDGAACAGTLLTLSHWPKSGTPVDLKRDSSAEIALAYLDSPRFHVNAEIVSNNHFDEDGLVGIYTLLDPATAQKQREFLIDVASAGDFGVYRQRDAARVSFAISACADQAMSPFPKNIFELPYTELAGQIYQRLLEVFPRLLTNLNDYKHLWEEEDARLVDSEGLFERGEIAIEEELALDLAIIRIPLNLPAGPVHRFTQSRMAECHPFAINSHTRCSRLLVIEGQRLEFQYRYESWVQFVSRRPLARVDLGGFVNELNQAETSGGRWVFEGVDKITPRLYLEASPKSSHSPEQFLNRLKYYLMTGEPAWNPYD